MAAILPIIGGPTRLSFLSLTPRLFQPFLRPSWSLPCEHSSSSPPAFSSSTSALTLLLEAASSSWTSTLDSFLELFPSILLAVPKKKVSHSRKSMRSANKGLKNKTSASTSYLHRVPGRADVVKISAIVRLVDGSSCRIICVRIVIPRYQEGERVGFLEYPGPDILFGVDPLTRCDRWKAQARGEDSWATSPVANESPVEGRGVGGSKESAATA